MAQYYYQNFQINKHYYGSDETYVMMYQRRNLYITISSILNSIQSTLSTATIGLRLTTSPTQIMLLNTQQLLPPPPSKLTLRSASNYTDFFLISRATSSTLRTNTPFFMKPDKPLGILHRAFAEGVLLFGSFWVVGFPHTIINWSSIP